MPSLGNCLLVTLTTLPFLLKTVVECRRDNWYPKICTTGMRQRVTYDDKGRISSFGDGDSFVPLEGNFPDDTDLNENDTEADGTGGRWLRRLANNLDVRSFASSPEGVSTALPWIRQTQEQQQGDGGIFFGQGSPHNSTVLPASQQNYSHSRLPELMRPCHCHPKYQYQNFFGPNETVPDLYLCPASAGYCGIPLPGTGPVVCFSVSVQEVVAVDAWPIVLLGYLGLVLICCCTIHGNTSIDFCRSFCDPQRNRRNVDRILARNASSQPPSQWNVWAWQNDRFERNLLAQTGTVLRFEDFTREQQRQAQGLPPPSYEMKTKRYSKEHCTTEDHGDDDSIHEPSCTICFVPLEEGDVVGDLACQHIFHKACLKSWCTRKNACPLCNTILATRRPDPQPHDIATTSNSSSSNSNSA